MGAKPLFAKRKRGCKGKRVFPLPILHFCYCLFRFKEASNGGMGTHVCESRERTFSFFVTHFAFLFPTVSLGLRRRVKNGSGNSFLLNAGAGVFLLRCTFPAASFGLGWWLRMEAKIVFWGRKKEEGSIGLLSCTFFCCLIWLKRRIKNGRGTHIR